MAIKEQEINHVQTKKTQKTKGNNNFSRRS
jgi:hypothetical protein